MSKTQEKRARRKAEQEAFIQERRAKQIALLEQSYADGIKMLEENKEKFSEEDLKTLETNMKEQREFIDKVKADWKIDGPTGS